MKFSTKILLALLSLGAILALNFGLNKYVEKKETQEEEFSRAIFFKSDDVVKITLKNSHGQFTLTRASDSPNALWNFVEPIAARADQDSANNILSSLNSLQVQQYLQGTENAVLESSTSERGQFGLDAPNFLVTVTDKNGKTQQLSAGKEINIGSKNSEAFEALSVYAWNPSKKTIFLIDKGTADSLKDKKFQEIRSRKVGEFEKYAVKRMVLNFDNKPIEIHKVGYEFKVMKPKEIPTDDNFVKSLIEKYAALHSKEIIEKADLTEAKMSELGLKVPSGSVEFYSHEGPLLQKFVFGISRKGVAVIMPDEAVAIIDLAQWPELVPSESDFKNKAVMLGVDMSKVVMMKLSDKVFFARKNYGWYRVASETDKPSDAAISNPKAVEFFANWEFMVASSLFENSMTNDLTRFGLDKPIKTITFAFDPASKMAPIEILMGSRVPGREKDIYIKRSDSSAVYTVNADWMKTLEFLIGNF